MISRGIVLILTSLAVYLIGAIPFGYLIARSQGVDILRQGSGNIGAPTSAVFSGRFSAFWFLCSTSPKGRCP